MSRRWRLVSATVVAAASIVFVAVLRRAGWDGSFAVLWVGVLAIMFGGPALVRSAARRSARSGSGMDGSKAVDAQSTER